VLAHLETTNDNREVPIGLYREALTEMTQHWGGKRADLAKVIEGWSDLLMMIFTNEYPYCEVTRVQSPLIFEFLVSVTNYEGNEDPVALLVSIQEFYTRFILGDDDDAIDVGRRALDHTRRMFGVRDKTTALATFVFAGAVYRTGNLEETESLLLDSLSIANETLGEKHYVVAAIKYFLGDLYAEQGKLDLAEPLLRDAVAISSKTVSEVYLELVVRGMKRLASLLREREQFAEAEQVDREADVLLAGRLWWGYQLYRGREEHEKARSVLQSALLLFSLDYQTDENGFPLTEMFEKTLFLQQATVAYFKNDRTRIEAVLQTIENRFPNDMLCQKAVHFRHLQKPPIPSVAVVLPEEIRTIGVSELEFEAASVSLGKPMRDQVPIVGAGTCFLQVDDEFFARGLFASAPSRYVVRLNDRWKRFRTQYGVQDGHPGRVVFVVRGDDQEIFRSPTITDNRIRQINLDVSGINLLELTVETIDEDGEIAWSVWMSPTLER
jgi:tetratricopeptide (TPR) repeat protein